MKKYWKLLLCAAMGIGTFTACEDVPAPYNIPTENGGTNNNNTTLFDYVYYQDFLSSPGEFTQSRTDSVKWTYSSKYGAIISGYQDWDNSGNKTNKPGVTILTSSEIDLSDVDSAFVIIDQAINYAKSTIEEDHKLLIKINEEGSKAVSLPMSYDGLGNDFSYIKQYVQIPQEFMGKKVKLGLRHVAHENYSSTWEVKSLGVAKGTAPSNEAPVIEDGVGSGTMDDPYDVPTTIKLIAAGPPSAKIYTKGIVSQVDEINEQYGNATYYISNDGTTTDQLEVYRGLGLGGAKFKADGIKVGDEVIVYGQVIYYNNKTMEFTQGSELYSLNGVTASKPDTSDATEVTCAKAVELTNALADNGTSTETYAVTGYITEVVGNVSKNQQTFWMADTKDGGKVFEAYWANLPEGVSAFKVGSKVKIIGQLMKYVKDGKVTPEIKNATVEILEEGSGDTPTPTPTPGEAKGTGTQSDPYNVTAAIANQGKTAWVQGYIVGWIDGKTLSSGAQLNGTATVNTNLLIADSANETDYNNCLPVQLPQGAVRDALNLKDNPSNYKSLVKLNGSLEKYFGAAGIKSVSEYELDFNSGEDPDPQPSGEALFSETFATSQGNFTIEDKTLPDGLSFVWKFDSKYGMKASAFANSTKYAAESWLISPEINLSKVNKATLTFDHAARYFGNAAQELTVWVKAGDTDYTQVTVPNYPSGSNWDFISSGDIDLTSFAGKKVKIAFKYTSSTSAAATWEIKNVLIK